MLLVDTRELRRLAREIVDEEITRAERRLTAKLRAVVDQRLAAIASARRRARR